MLVLLAQRVDCDPFRFRIIGIIDLLPIHPNIHGVPKVWRIVAATYIQYKRHFLNVDELFVGFILVCM